VVELSDGAALHEGGEVVCFRNIIDVYAETVEVFVVGG
jgi:hypothetical protein